MWESVRWNTIIQRKWEVELSFSICLNMELYPIRTKVNFIRPVPAREGELGGPIQLLVPPVHLPAPISRGIFITYPKQGEALGPFPPTGPCQGPGEAPSHVCDHTVLCFCKMRGRYFHPSWLRPPVFPCRLSCHTFPCVRWHWSSQEHFGDLAKGVWRHINCRFSEIDLCGLQ